MHLLEEILRFVKSQQARGQAPGRFQGTEAAWKSTKGFLIRIERLKIFPVQLKVFPELNPVIAGSLVWVGQTVGRLRTNLNFGLRSPVIFAFSLADEDGSEGVPNLDCVFSLRVEDRKFVGPGLLGNEINLLTE